MKNKIFTLSLFLISTLLSCNNKEYFKIEGLTQGTSYTIIYQGMKNSVLKSDIDSVLADFDMSLSTYNKNSVISRINSGETDVVTDKYFKDMFEEAKKINKISKGAFDITVAPLVNAWGFGFTEIEEKPDSALIDSLLKYVGMSNISLKNGIIKKKYKQVMLDGSAIAQGQSVDIISVFLEKKGINDYLVEIGGELKAKGKKFGRNWIIGVDKPVEGLDKGEDIQVKIELDNKALATSGNYRQFYVEDGKKYSHSINPKTGYPASQNILSATIITDKCISADAYATACMVLGLDKSIEMINNIEGLDAYLIYSDEKAEMKVYFTEGIKNIITE